MSWTKEMVEQAREFFGERFDDFTLVNTDGTKYDPEAEFEQEAWNECTDVPEVQGSEEEYMDSMEAQREEEYLAWLAESEIVDSCPEHMESSVPFTKLKHFSEEYYGQRDRIAYYVFEDKYSPAEEYLLEQLESGTQTPWFEYVTNEIGKEFEADIVQYETLGNRVLVQLIWLYKEA